MMRTLVTALLATAATVAQAVQPAPAPAYYAVHLWGVPGGDGMAFVVGPIDRDQCGNIGSALIAAAASTVPPNMDTFLSTCVDKVALTMMLNAQFICAAAKQESLPKIHASLWAYVCYWRP